MKRKTFFLASAGALGLAAVTLINLGTTSLGLTKADAAHSSHSGKLTKIGFDWKDPTQDGYMPYYRCAQCCASDPSTSRFSIEDGKTRVSEDDIKIPALASADESDVSAALTTFNVLDCWNIDQIVKSEEDYEGYVNATYVSDGDHKGVYFSRSRNADGGFDSEGEDEGSHFEFKAGLDSETAVSSVTFSYRCKNWSEDASVVSELYYEQNEDGVVSVESAEYSLKNLVFNDGKWHTLTIYTKNILGEDSVAGVSDFGFQFADFQGYIILSDLSFGTDTVSNSVSLLNVGSSSVASEDNDIADFSIEEGKAYKDEACSTSVESTDAIASLKKVYVKVPLSFSTITSGGRAAQDSAVGRLKVDIDLNGELLEGASVTASLKGFTDGTWFGTYMSGNFINETALTASSSTKIQGTMDTAISQTGIYALITFDFTNSNAYALSHALNAFRVNAVWSAYKDTMSDFTDSIKPVAYITGEENGWVTTNLIHQMVPDLTATGSAVTWVYKNLTGFSKIKVVHNGGWNGCRYCEPYDYQDTTSDAALTSTTSYNVYYITGESTFYVKLAA